MALKLAALFVGLFLGLGIAADSQAQGTAQPGAGRPYKFLVIAGLTGSTSLGSKMVLAGIQASAEYVNAHGGLMGRRIEVSSLDSQSDPIKAVSVLQGALASSDRPDLVLCSGSAESLAIGPVLRQEKILGFTNSASDRFLDLSPLLFSFTPKQSIKSEQLADYTASQRPKTVGLLTANDAYGNSAGQSALAMLNKMGLTVVSEKLDPKAIDMSSYLERLKAQNVDFLIYDALGPQAGYVLKSRTKVGWTIPTVAASGSASFDLATLVGPEDLKGVTAQYSAGSVVGSDISKKPIYSTMYNGVKAKFGGAFPAQMLNALISWDMVQVLSIAVPQAKSFDPERIAATLDNLKEPPEKERPYVFMRSYQWRPGSHLPDGEKSDWIIIPVAKLADGLLHPQ